MKSITLLLAALLPLAAPARAQVKAPPRLSYDQLTEKHHLKAKRSLMEKAFPATKQGAALSRVATLYKHASTRERAEGESQVRADLALLREDPEASLRDIRAGLGRLPAGTHRERQFLIQLGARLPASASAREDFLNEQLLREPGAQEGPAALFSAAVAVEMLAGVVGDQGRVRALVGAALAKRTDDNARRLLLAVLGKTDPEGAASLAKKLGVK